MVPGKTHIFVRNYMDKYLRDLLEMQELTDIISCALLMHMKNRIHHLVMVATAVGFVHYHNIQQQKNWFFLDATINFIGYWLKSIEHNVIERCNMYVFNMNIFFRKYQLNFLNNPVQRKTRIV